MNLDIRQNAVVTPDDHGPILGIVTLFLMVMLILAVLMRLIIKYLIRRTLTGEDGLVAITMILAVTQSIAVSLAISNGLGKRQSALTNSEILSIEKLYYVSDLLYVATLGLTKISVFQLLGQLAVSIKHKLVTKVGMVLVMLWAVPGFFVLAFKCGDTAPWDIQSGKCIRLFPFWVAMTPLDAITEIVMVMLPILMMRPVQVAVSKKAVIIVAFSFRTLVIVAIFVRLYYLRIALASKDISFDSINAAVLNQCVLSFSITTACVPSLKPFLDAFDSGMLGVTPRTRKGTGYSNGISYEMNNFSGVKGSMINTRNRDNDDGKGVGYLVAIRANKRSTTQERSGSFSSTKSEAMIIKRIDNWEVQYEHVEPTQPSSSSNENESNTELRKIEHYAL